ncbi:MAG: sigma-54-dependent Fis family transcriptional regulator [Alphaproteobacteria bacterium]|nr:MAG: sigma-54-dependent Fis family transcriptional regulator [Alphaproteobacteria bacterium]
MAKTGNILIVDDDQDILIAARLLLKRHFASVSTTNRPDQIRKILRNQEVDAVLLDMNFTLGADSGTEGLHWLGDILAVKPDMIVIVITAHGGVELAVEAMKKGATDFITKPWENAKLVSTLRTAVRLAHYDEESKKLKSRNREMQHSLDSADRMIGDSQAIAQVMEIIGQAAPTEANIMILGENGTGKELIAREIHRQSLRRDAALITVDLGSISENLFESELFGHKKGAFTDAREDRIGLMQAAEGGTLFLDEIGNLPLALQTKLLTALERRQVTPVGSNKPVAINIRLISATNVSPEELSKDNIFRQDLRYRLNTVEIQVPPLRDRRSDIPQLVDYFVRHYARKYNQSIRLLSQEAHKILRDYHWPGNIRELRHGVERAIILAQGEQLEATDFPIRMEQDGGEASFTSPVGKDQITLEELEKIALETALKRHRGNISRAAKDLGITRASLYRRMEKHEL